MTFYGMVGGGWWVWVLGGGIGRAAFWVAGGGFASVASYVSLALVMAAVKVGLMVWVPSGCIEMRGWKRVRASCGIWFVRGVWVLLMCRRRVLCAVRSVASWRPERVQWNVFCHEKRFFCLCTTVTAA